MVAVPKKVDLSGFRITEHGVMFVEYVGDHDYAQTEECSNYDIRVDVDKAKELAKKVWYSLTGESVKFD
ncbi:MAG: hypothetical protein MPF33_11140 [Candidatus Aramenus sp.]|nr:hypothetical protein [Candidatus Aramenus sp.]